MLILVLTLMVVGIGGIEIVLPNILMLNKQCVSNFRDDPVWVIEQGKDYGLTVGKSPLVRDGNNTKIICRYYYGYPDDVFRFDDAVSLVKSAFDTHNEFVVDTDEHYTHGYIDQKARIGIWIYKSKPSDGRFKIEYITEAELRISSWFWSKYIPMHELK